MLKADGSQDSHTQRSDRRNKATLEALHPAHGDSTQTRFNAMTRTQQVGGGRVLAALVWHVAEVVESHGLAMRTLFETTGIKPSLLGNGLEPVPAIYFETLVCAAVDASADPVLGLRTSGWTSLEGFGVLGYIFQTCTTLQHAIEMGIQYEGLVSDISTTTLRHEPGTALLCCQIRTDNPTFEIHATDYILGFLRKTLRRLLRGHSDPIRYVCLAHAAPSDPADVAEYEKVFGCPVYFDSDCSALGLAVEALKWPLGSPDPRLHTVLEQHARHLLDDKPWQEGAFLTWVRGQLSALLKEGNASRVNLARIAGVSARHLGRHLKRHGVTYRELFDELRLELACEYLGQSDRTIKDIADSLGFAESQSFIRWFRKQQAMSPGQFRALRHGD